MEDGETRCTPQPTPSRPKRGDYYIASSLDDGRFPCASEKFTSKWKTTVALINSVFPYLFVINQMELFD